MSFDRPDIIRPPSEWRSYYLPITSGCSNNTCTFCNYYGSKLGMREVEAVKKEIDALKLYMGHGIQLTATTDIIYAVARQWDGKRVFLQDGDALVYSFPKMVEVLEYLNEKFPDLERVACYATPQDILRRSIEELKALKELKLNIFYSGLESGADEILARIGKGVDSSEMVEAGRRVEESGITFSVTVILGLAGVEESEQHARATAHILSEIDPEYAGALTLTLVPGTPLYQQWREGHFHQISPFQSLEELKIIMEDTNFTRCFFSSMHASNYFAIRGLLPRDKDRMVGEVRRIIETGDSALLRPEFLRAL